MLASATEAQGQLRDLPYSPQLGLCGSNKLPCCVVKLCGVLQQIKNIAHSFHRIIDLVSDGCCHSSSDCQLLRISKGLLCHFDLGDIPRYGGGADDIAVTVANRRDGQGHR